MEVYSCKTKICTGSGSLEEVKRMGCHRLFLVSDPYFDKNGTAQRVIDLSGAKEATIYTQVTPDPTVEQVAMGTAQLKAFDPDGLVALGGGSAIDLAKAMLYFWGKDLIFTAIPTTSGSGSEVTDFAILTYDGVKHPLIDETLRPHIAILDSDLLTQLPQQLVADTGFDVLSHALESYVANNSGDFSRALSRAAFCTVISHLHASYNGICSVRQKIHNASTMAGLAFTHAGLGLCHAMSHALGGRFHLPHGRLNAILLPAVIQINSETAGKLYAELARYAGLGSASDGVAVRNLKNALISLRRSLNLPGTLTQAGISPAQVYKEKACLIEAVLQDPCCHTNPVAADKSVVAGLLEAVT